MDDLHKHLAYWTCWLIMATVCKFTRRVGQLVHFLYSRLLNKLIRSKVAMKIDSGNQTWNGKSGKIKTSCEWLWMSSSIKHLKLIEPNLGVCQHCTPNCFFSHQRWLKDDQDWISHSGSLLSPLPMSGLWKIRVWSLKLERTRFSAAAWVRDRVFLYFLVLVIWVCLKMGYNTNKKT